MRKKQMPEKFLKSANSDSIWVKQKIKSCTDCTFNEREQFQLPKNATKLRLGGLPYGKRHWLIKRKWIQDFSPVCSHKYKYPSLSLYRGGRKQEFWFNNIDKIKIELKILDRLDEDNF